MGSRSTRSSGKPSTNGAKRKKNASMSRREGAANKTTKKSRKTGAKHISETESLVSIGQKPFIRRELKGRKTIFEEDSESDEETGSLGVKGSGQEKGGSTAKETTEDVILDKDKTYGTPSTNHNGREQEGLNPTDGGLQMLQERLVTKLVTPGANTPAAHGKGGKNVWVEPCDKVYLLTWVGETLWNCVRMFKQQNISFFTTNIVVYLFR